MAKKNDPAPDGALTDEQLASRERALKMTMGQGAPAKETEDGGQADDQTDAADDGAADQSAETAGDGE